MARRARLVGLIAGFCLSLAPHHDAAARKFQMSGTWIYRTGHVFLPLQFGTAVLDPMAGTVHQSMGNLTGAYGFPNGPIPGQGGVTATGSAPATLRVPAHRFVEDAMTVLPGGVDLEQIATSFGVDAPYAEAILSPGGGPGSFTWSPGDPACAAGGRLRSTDPPNDGTRNGRIIYREGAHRFGGAMQLGLRRGGSTAAFFSLVPYRVGYNVFGGVGSGLRGPATGALGSADLPALRKLFLPRAFVTQPTMSPPPFRPIRHPRPEGDDEDGRVDDGDGPDLLPADAGDRSHGNSRRPVHDELRLRPDDRHGIRAADLRDRGPGLLHGDGLRRADAARRRQPLARRRRTLLPQHAGGPDALRELPEGEGHARSADPVALADGCRRGRCARAARGGLRAAAPPWNGRRPGVKSPGHGRDRELRLRTARCSIWPSARWCRTAL